MHDLPKNFCIAPFTQITAHPNGSFSPCPYLGGTTWTKKYNTITEQFQGQDLENLRSEFLSNQQSSVCNRCWHEEHNNKKSLRLRLYDPVNKISDYSIINNSSIIADLTQGLPNKKYLTDLKILTIKNGNLCNAKCRVCHPGDSSRWAIEDAPKLKHMLGTQIRGHKIYHTNSTENNWTDQQCDEIFEISKTLVRLELFGGEPLYNKKVLKLLDRIVQAGHSANINLYINTNGSVDLTGQVPQIAKFKEVEIGVSIDDIDKRFNYQRHGLEYNQVVENIKKWQEHFSKFKTPLYIDSITTVSVYNILYLPEIKESVQRILPQSPFWNLLIWPDHLFIKNMPDQIKHQVIKKLESDLEFEEIINVLSQPRDPIAWTKFVQIRDTLDIIRDENFQEVFPELASMIDNS
jgi:MoaA/NifB/PqqE/SkfB family radical SAM enzyme